MSWVKYTDWYTKHRFRAKFRNFYDQETKKFIETGVIATYKGFQLCIEKRDIEKDNHRYTKMSIIKPNNEKVEFLYSGYLEKITLDYEFTNRVKEIIKKEKLIKV